MTESDFRLFSNVLDRLIEAGYTHLDLAIAIAKWRDESDSFYLAGRNN